jgi:hypothetical protein
LTSFGGCSPGLPGRPPATTATRCKSPWRSASNNLASNCRSLPLPPPPSRQQPRRPLQEGCQEAGSIDAANAPGSPESRFLTCESIASVSLERPPTGARPRLYWSFHHLHCLSNRRRSDRPRSAHPCHLWQVLALSGLVPFSLKVFNILCMHSGKECFHAADCQYEGRTACPAALSVSLPCVPVCGLLLVQSQPR